MSLYKIYPVDNGTGSTTQLHSIGEYSNANKRIQCAGAIHYINTDSGSLWERLDAQYPPLSVYTFGNHASALGVNSVYPSQVVGWLQNDGNVNHLPFLFEKGGSTILNTFGGIAGEARSINNNGDIAGWSLDNYGQRRACIWQSAAHNILDLGTLGGMESEAFAINNMGQVAGWAHDGNGNTHAFIWTPGAADGVQGNPQMKDIHLPGSNASIAMALNDNGHVVGQLQLAVEDAFYWSQNSGTIILPSLGFNATAKGINNNDLIVGQSVKEAGNTPRAVSWSGFRISDLNDLVSVNNTWIIMDAVAINSDGYIACNAKIGIHQIFFSGLILDPIYLRVHPPFGPQADMIWPLDGDVFPDDFMLLTQITAYAYQMKNKKRKKKLHKFLLRMIKKTIS